eukprot:GILJ01011130.1.p1 GENE.GILJ01011130.1~~GILJ01011130.1.p1  ORF type:complete len:417 (+),score=41.05 GILJ01011130.1:119-1369(+)
MANTAIQDEAQKREIFDSPEVLDVKVGLLAEWILTSNHFIVFTGAGVSTSTGIPDFRSGMNTKLPTGPGVWELKAHGLARNANSAVVSSLRAIPSPTHMALVELQRCGLLKFLVTQNTDGLHRRSGFPPSLLAELHGNTNLERCESCGKEYLRDFQTRRCPQHVHNHYTGRFCDDRTCQGRLIDSIVNFGENLPTVPLQQSFKHAESADLCLCLGSSLRVTPAANIPETVPEHGGKLVIVNLQPTPLDSICDLRIFALVDDVMQRLMQLFEMSIPRFMLARYVRLEFSQLPSELIQDNLDWELHVRGIDEQGQPYSIFVQVDFILPAAFSQGNFSERVEPFVLRQCTPTVPEYIDVRVHFQGHYGEPPVLIHLPIAPLQAKMVQTYRLDFDLQALEWRPNVIFEKDSISPDHKLEP